MTYDYGRAQATFARLVEKFGQRAVLSRTVAADKGATGQPWNPSSDASKPVTSSWPCRVVITDYSDRERLNGSVDVKARKALLSTRGLPKGLQIDGSFRLQLAAVTYDVKPPITTYDPGGVVLGYEFQVLA